MVNRDQSRGWGVVAKHTKIPSQDKVKRLSSVLLLVLHVVGVLCLTIGFSVVVGPMTTPPGARRHLSRSYRVIVRAWLRCQSEGGVCPGIARRILFFILIKRGVLCLSGWILILRPALEAIIFEPGQGLQNMLIVV